MPEAIVVGIDIAKLARHINTRVPLGSVAMARPSW